MCERNEGASICMHISWHTCIFIYIVCINRKNTVFTTPLQHNGPRKLFYISQNSIFFSFAVSSLHPRLLLFCFFLFGITRFKVSQGLLGFAFHILITGVVSSMRINRSHQLEWFASIKFIIDCLQVTPNSYSYSSLSSS